MALILYHLILSASFAMVVATFRALPAWIYRIPIMNRKPMNCEKCLSFWTMIILGISAGVPWYLLILHGMTGMMAVILLLNYFRS